MFYEVLRYSDYEKWIHLLDQCEKKDIHYHPDFMNLHKEKLDGEPELFVLIEEDQNFLLFPYFKRKINPIFCKNLPKSAYDIVSPWYFAGPITKTNKKREYMLKCFFEYFPKFCSEQNIISEYTRINPLIDYGNFYTNLSHANTQYDISYIDLTQSFSDIFKNFKKSTRNAIGSSEKKSVKIIFSNNKNDLNFFYKLYIDTMKRVMADKFYFFDTSYFESLFDLFSNDCILVSAKLDDKIISSSIFIFKYGIAYYWLSGFDVEYKSFNPNNLIMSKAIQFLQTKNNSILILGGGTNKSLRKFKNSFTDLSFPFYINKKIYNKEIYSQLVLERNKLESKTNKTFFPLYRG